jgi:hypothetical protein
MFTTSGRAGKEVRLTGAPPFRHGSVRPGSRVVADPAGVDGHAATTTSTGGRVGVGVAAGSSDVHETDATHTATDKATSKGDTFTR